MSGLDVNPEIPIEEGLAKYDVKPAVQSRLLQLGITPPPPPQISTNAGVQQYRGEIPSDLTHLTDDQLGSLMGLVSSWQDYIGYQVALIHAEMTEAQKKLEQVQARLRLVYKYDETRKKRTEQEREDKMLTDRRYVEVQAEVLYHESLYRLVRAISVGAEKNFNAISRRITQRGQDIERQKRSQNVVNMPMTPMFRR